mmetsp:Transcript_4988/g.10540  ORF Transcript_4988/g.10540 Transcript_4988/m.10540 type:complete len:1600 (+) Transcript_4988:272-5071(+)
MTTDDKASQKDTEVAADGDKAAAEKEPPAADVYIRNLCILPPRQKSNVAKARRDLDALGAIPLPSLRPEEPVQSIRAALGEVKDYAHLTNYRLVVEERPDGIEAALAARRKGAVDGTSASGGKSARGGSTHGGGGNGASSKRPKKKKSKGGGGGSGSGSNTPRGSSPLNKTISPAEVVSPHTGPDAVVSIPATVRSLEADPAAYTPYLGSVVTDSNSNVDGGAEEEIVLDEFTDLNPYMDHGLHSDNAALRIVLERYDVAGVRDHITRLRSIFDGLIPNVTTLAEGEDAVGEEKKKTEENGKEGDYAENSAAEVDTVVATAEEGGEGDEKKEELKDVKEKQRAELLSKMPNFPLESTITVDGSNLADYFYLACGEEDDLDAVRGRERKASVAKASASREGRSADSNAAAAGEDAAAEAEAGRNAARRMVELESHCRVRCKIKFGGFHPPPAHRRIHGDLAYLEVTLPGASEDVVHVTAVPAGFYVNKTTIAPDGYSEPYVFDPRPADNACYSHELLDCLLQYSKSLRSAWADALECSKERAELTVSMATSETPVQSLYRVATRGDFGGALTAASSLQNIDALLIRPSWLVPVRGKSSAAGASDVRHEYNEGRADEDLASTFGLDVRGGALRDWNEELQTARELPKDTLQDRMERAKMVHKTLVDFGDAALVGAKAIVEGLIVPINPNEPARSHVYFHNNIFFSRAVDAGVDTFKISQGDRAARKAASRDANCVGLLHRFDIDGLHNLATVLVDYLGTRLVCQSIVPGILQGEKTHTLLCGSVEATQPLSWDEDMHKLLEENLGRGFMIATRPVPTLPLSDERMALIQELRAVSPGLSGVGLGSIYKEKKTEVIKPLTEVCGPVEAKGIRGSDQRNYILDLCRLTPRDANWVPESEGGTGRWEAVASTNQGNASAKTKKYVPESLGDEEHTMAVFRSELVTLLTHKEMAKYLAAKKKKESNEQGKKDGDSLKASGGDETDVKNKEDNDSTNKIDAENEEYLKSLRLNPNVFLPNIKSLEGIDDEAFKQIKKDEERVREAAAYLWGDVLPTLTLEIRENTGHILPVDGKTLCDTLHQRGVNCRYLGRLAALAIEEEAKDRKAEADFASGTAKSLPRRTMPLCWLELLECEMVARAAKHVLDSYLVENGNAAAAQPAQTVACFLSAILSTDEERAGETELRLKKSGAAEESEPTASVVDTLLGPTFQRSRAEIWDDIEREIGHRYRYVLTLYNTHQTSDRQNGEKTKSRAMYTPLLRRLCQRNGVRLVAKNYELGGKCLCSGRNSYPIATRDIAGILPLVKHAAAAAGGEGFHPASFDCNSGPTSLHVLLPDAKNLFDTAHAAWNQKALPQALDLFQEASSLFQRVVDTPLHATVAKCLEMSAAILFHAGEAEAAAANAARSLAVAVQLGGFDSADALNAHSTLSHILLSSNAAGPGIKHLRASLYLTELLAGPHNTDLATSYHKLGTMYHEVGSPINALRFYQEATARESADRLVSGMVAKSTALVLANIGQFKGALEMEKRAYNLYRSTLGEGHDLTKNSSNTLAQFTKIAVEQGTRKAKEEQKQKEEEAANAMANEVVAGEAAAAKKRQKKKKRKPKKN